MSSIAARAAPHLNRSGQRSRVRARLPRLVDRRAGAVLVANISSNTVSVINARDNRVVASVRAGMSPFAIGVNARAHTAYVTNVNDNTVSVLARA